MSRDIKWGEWHGQKHITHNLPMFQQIEGASNVEVPQEVRTLFNKNRENDEHTDLPDVEPLILLITEELANQPEEIDPPPLEYETNDEDENYEDSEQEDVSDFEYESDSDSDDENLPERTRSGLIAVTSPTPRFMGGRKQQTAL
jgi:hypothetical protein